MPQLTIEDIARLAGVSRSTVSRVLNDHPSVRPGVRNHILAVIKEHGYAPQAAARNLVNQRTHVIGVMFSRTDEALLTNPIFASIGMGIGQVCAQRGYISMLSLGSHTMEEHMFFNMLRSRHFDGIVLISSDSHDTLPSFLKEANIPYTRVGQDPEMDDLNFVDVDNVEGAYKAVKHLISLHHQRIAFIKGPAWELCNSARHEGYNKALQEAGLPLDPELVYPGDWSDISGYQAVEHFLRFEQPPTAIFTANDMMAAGAIHAIYDHGLTVPDDMAIVGFDDLPQTGIIRPALTTIRQPSIELGARATEMLIDQLENKDYQPAHTILPTTLIVRQSCGGLRQRAEASQTPKDPSVLPIIPSPLSTVQEDHS